MRVNVRAFTDTGLRRKRNEDAVMVGGWVSQTHNGVLVEMRMQPGSPFVCAVCDGIGGHVGGDVASRTALSMIATCAKPPRIQPVSTVDNLIRRSVIPDSFIRCPANTKSGTASSGKDWVMVVIFWTAICVGTGPKM